MINEEIKVKDDIIKALSEANQESENGENDTESVAAKPTEPRENTRKEKTNDMTEKFECNECSYTTSTKTNLMGHIIAHSGQYQGQRGCKQKFKTFRAY